MKWTARARRKAANVPIRMLQHYEQRVKVLGKAAFDTVFRLARALHVGLAEGDLIVLGDSATGRGPAQFLSEDQHGSGREHL